MVSFFQCLVFTGGLVGMSLFVKILFRAIYFGYILHRIIRSIVCYYQTSIAVAVSVGIFLEEP